MATLRDGLGGEELGDVVDAGSKVNTLWITGSITTEDQISGANIYSTGTLNGATGSINDIVNAEGAVESVSTGSKTAVYGNKIQAGSGTLSAGSNDWIVYPNAYVGTPIVVAIDTTTADKALLLPIGSMDIGSAYIEGPTAADEYTWIAVGL